MPMIMQVHQSQSQSLQPNKNLSATDTTAHITKHRNFPFYNPTCVYKRTLPCKHGDLRQGRGFALAPNALAPWDLMPPSVKQNKRKGLQRDAAPFLLACAALSWLASRICPSGSPDKWSPDRKSSNKSAGFVASENQARVYTSSASSHTATGMDAELKASMIFMAASSPV